MLFPWQARKEIQSPKNGSISLSYMFGRPVVSVDLFFQAGPYITAMWKKVLRFVPRTASIKRVLILGYGAGGANRLICRRFPRAKITAIEWDPEMVELGKELRLHRKEDLEDLRVGDAADVVHDLKGPFDLVLFDLYRGKEPSPLVEDPVFLARLQSLMSRDGYFLVNVFRKHEAIKTVAKFFSLRETWKYRWNNGGVFRPFGCGGYGDPLLPGFLPYHAIPALLEREMVLQPAQTFLQGDGYAGRRWKVGPAGFEFYYSDTEPHIEQMKGARIIYWQTLTRMDVPTGWRRARTMHSFQKTGYAPVGTLENYWAEWSSHALRHRKKWLAHPDAEIREVPVDEFAIAYERGGTLDWMTKRMFVWMLKRKAEAHGELLHCLLAVTPGGEAIAGLAVLDIPEAKTALHVIAFYTKAARHSSVNYGLVDYWFKDAIQKGWKYLDFDVFRGPTESRAWEGYSRFKGQFGTRFILYPKTLTRIVW